MIFSPMETLIAIYNHFGSKKKKQILLMLHTKRAQDLKTLKEWTKNDSLVR